MAGGGGGGGGWSEGRTMVLERQDEYIKRRTEVGRPNPLDPSPGGNKISYEL